MISNYTINLFSSNNTLIPALELSPYLCLVTTQMCNLGKGCSVLFSITYKADKTLVGCPSTHRQPSTAGTGSMQRWSDYPRDLRNSDPQLMLSTWPSLTSSHDLHYAFHGGSAWL